MNLKPISSELSLSNNEKIALELLDEYFLSLASSQEFEKNGQIRDLMVAQKNLSIIRKQALKVIQDTPNMGDLAGPNEAILRQAREILTAKRDNYIELVKRRSEIEKANLIIKNQNRLKEYFDNFNPSKKEKTLEDLRKNSQYQLAIHSINIESLKLCEACSEKVKSHCKFCNGDLIIGSKKKITKIKKDEPSLYELIVLLMKCGIKSSHEFENSWDRYKGESTISPNLLPISDAHSYGDPREHKRWQCKWCQGDGGINGGCARCSGTGLEP